MSVHSVRIRVESPAAVLAVRRDHVRRGQLLASRVCVHQRVHVNCDQHRSVHRHFVSAAATNDHVSGQDHHRMRVDVQR